MGVTCEVLLVMMAVDVGTTLKEVVVETILAVAVNTKVSSVVDGFSSGDIDNGELVGTVGLTDEITVEVVDKMVEIGVMITLDSPTTSTAGKLQNAS